MTDDKKTEVKNPYWKPTDNPDKWVRPGQKRRDQVGGYGADTDFKGQDASWMPGGKIPQGKGKLHHGEYDND